MITKPTVFILGAGASMDYGFPSGKTLIDQICNDICGAIPNDILKEVFNQNVPMDILLGNTNEFREALLGSGCYSIDAFLEDRPDLQELGVLLLASLIMKKEQESHLQDGWYKYLLNCMTSRFETFKDNQLTIVTFNYDRSFEQYMFNSLKHRFNRSDKETAQLVKTVPVYHAYGHIGPLPWQDNRNGMKYGTKPICGAIHGAADRLKLIYQNQTEVLQSNEVKKALSEAESIYFLGFGYARENMARIPIDWSKEPSKIRSTIAGTMLGMTSAEVKKLQQSYRCLKAGNNTHRIEEFLKNNDHFLMSGDF